jgi:hypothetical protein
MLVNQYSFVWVGLILLSLAAGTIWRYYGLKNSIISGCLILLVLCCVQLLLSTKNHEVNTFTELEKELNAEKPVLLMIYSDY